MRGKKCEQKTAMITNTGEMTEDEQSIKNVYMDFYKTLLSTKNATTAEEIEAEKNVNRTFRIIEAIALNQNPIEIKAEHIVEVVKKLSRRKAGDRQEWTNELILEGGDEMTVAASTQHKLYSLLLPPAMGARFYRFLGRPAKWTRWLAGAAAIKSG